MPTPNYGTDLYSSANYAGGGLQDYAGLPFEYNPPYENLGYTTTKPGGITKVFSHGDPIFGSLFGGGKKKPNTPAWQREANKAYNTTYAALSAQSRLYEPTLALTRRNVADYGDLYRRAQNDQLAFEMGATRTKRAGDLADFSALGPEYIAALRQSNPQLAALYDMSQQELALGDQLSPGQRRNIQQAVRAGQAARGMGMGPADVYEEAIQTSGYGDQIKQQRFNNARNTVGLYGDVFQATTGRPSQIPNPVGANISAPNAGVGVDDYLSQIINRQIQKANMGAAEDANQMALYGSIIQAVGGLAGGAAGIACWVAREVFGEASPKWRQFRHWLFTRGPRSLLRQYLQHGEQAAAYLKRHPELKPRVREFMEQKIAELQPV